MTNQPCKPAEPSSLRLQSSILQLVVIQSLHQRSRHVFLFTTIKQFFFSPTGTLQFNPSLSQSPEDPREPQTSRIPIKPHFEPNEPNQQNRKMVKKCSIMYSEIFQLNYSKILWMCGCFTSTAGWNNAELTLLQFGWFTFCGMFIQVHVIKSV